MKKIHSQSQLVLMKVILNRQLAPFAALRIIRNERIIEESDKCISINLKIESMRGVIGEFI